MGAGLSSFRQSGGYLGKGATTIKTLRWSDKFKDFENTNAKEDFQWLYAVVGFQADGAEDVQEHHFKAGNALDFHISDDEQTLDPIDGGRLFGNAAFFRFYQTLVNPLDDAENGFDESLLDATAENIDYTPILGSRVEVGQEIDPAYKGKKRKDKKTGKEYDYERPVVKRFLGMTELKAAKKTADKAAAPAAKGKAAKSVDISEVATDAIQRYLASTPDHSLPKGKARLKVLTDAKFANDDALKSQVADWIMGNLDKIEGVDFDAKKGTLTLAA